LRNIEQEQICNSETFLNDLSDPNLPVDHHIVRATST
jgi:hypothetical protein